jgi:hypothetical protein
MAEKITDLIAGSTPLSGGELLEIVQGADSRSAPVSAVDHNTISGLQGGITSAGEYYHLSQSIHDGLYSASPIIGLGNETGTRVEVDYGSQEIDGYISNTQFFYLGNDFARLGTADSHVEVDDFDAVVIIETGGQRSGKFGETGLRLKNVGATVGEFSIDGTLADDSDSAVPTEKAVKTYVDAQIATTDEHNELLGLQGGIPSASEYYHLSQSIHDGLFSASPIIGLGVPSGTNLQVDYSPGGGITAAVEGVFEVNNGADSLTFDAANYKFEVDFNGYTGLVIDHDPTFSVDDVWRAYVRESNFIYKEGDTTNNFTQFGCIVSSSQSSNTNSQYVTFDDDAEKTTFHNDAGSGGADPLNLTEFGIQLEIGQRVNEFSTDGTMAGNSDSVIPTEKAIRTFVASVSASSDDHNELNNIQGGIPSASEYYHLSQSIHDGLYSASPVIGLGVPSGTNFEVDYDSHTIKGKLNGNLVLEMDEAVQKFGDIASGYYFQSEPGESVSMQIIGEEDPIILSLEQGSSNNSLELVIEGTLALFIKDQNGEIRTKSGRMIEWEPNGNISIGRSTRSVIAISDLSDRITLNIDNATEVTLTTSGMALKTGPSVNEFSTDGTLAGDSDTAIPTEKAVKTYVDPNVSTETAQVTASNNDIVLANGTGGVFTVYLQDSDNAVIRVKKIDAVNNITVEGLSGNIDGQANTTLTSQYESKTFVWDGTNWFIV